MPCPCSLGAVAQLATFGQAPSLASPGLTGAAPTTEKSSSSCYVDASLQDATLGVPMSEENSLAKKILLRTDNANTSGISLLCSLPHHHLTN